MGAALDDSLIILDTILDGYARLDRDLRFTFANRAVETLFKKTRAELCGKPVQEFCPLLEQTCRRALAEQVVVSSEHYSEEARAWYAVTVMPDEDRGLCARFEDITGRKQMEDALRKTREKFSKAFHSSPAAMCILDIDRNAAFIDVNEAFERITGYSRNEVVGRTTTELGLYADPRDLELSRERLLREGGYRNLEIRFRKKDGGIATGLVSAEQIELHGALCAISVAVDITDYRLAEQALRESEELYRQLFEVESDALFLVDQQSGNLLAANAAACVLYGYSRKQLLSMNRVDVSGEPAKTIEATTTHQKFIPLRWHKKKDGTIFPVEISNCYFDLKGREVFVSAIRDITARRQMEQAVKVSEEKFSKAFHSNPNAVTIVDLDSKTYLEINEAFEKMTGFQRAEVIGRNWSDFTMWTDPQDRDKTIAQLLQEGGVRDREFRFRKKSGDIGAGLLSAELIEIEGRQCALTAIVDITGRIELERQLRQAQKLESVGRLAGGVAHDFNNLLTIINGYSDFILETSSAPEPLRLHVQEIKKAGERAAALTGQLLAFSRKQVIAPKPLDLNNTVHDAERMLRRIIGEDIELVTGLDPAAGRVMADPNQVYQVIMNLVVNARDAMPDGGRLDIATSNVEVDAGFAASHPEALPGNYVMLSVTDTGVGMDEKTLQQAFEPFFTTKEQGKGTGLGLSTVYGIVQQSGGWIQVSSEPGAGTTVRVYLPRVDIYPAPVVVQAPTVEALQGGETILVVEDHEELRTLTTTILNTYGYHVLEAANSDEAFEIARQHVGEIDLLLTDVILPGMNGKELSERLRTSRPNLKVLFTSGYAEDVIAHRGVLDVDAAYLPKPFSPESLAAKVREALACPAKPPRAGGSSFD